MPATPADAKGLMLAAIRDDNPVLFVEAMSLAHGRARGDVPARTTRRRSARRGSPGPGAT